MATLNFCRVVLELMVLEACQDSLDPRYSLHYGDSE